MKKKNPNYDLDTIEKDVFSAATAEKAFFRLAHYVIPGKLVMEFIEKINKAYNVESEDTATCMTEDVISDLL